RREFIKVIAGSVPVTWSIATHAQQQGERMRRIGALVLYAEADPQGKPRVAAFLQGLQTLGWTEGRNVQIDIRWGVADAASSRRYAAEMFALAPHVILTGGSAATAAVHESTHTLPIMLAAVVTPAERRSAGSWAPGFA